MAKLNILDPDKTYTFSNYFDLNYEPDEILAEFGFALNRTDLILPRVELSLEPLIDLKNSIQRRLPLVSLTSETARREVLIAPIVLTLLDYTQAQLRIEYAINVSQKLKGSFDYYLNTQENLLIIEAKNADLTRGFTQLAVELIALDQWTNSETDLLYGVVSTGTIWQFGCLHRQQKQIDQDLNLYRVPADLPELFQSLVAILTVKR
ncbi:MAG: hypothetical protein ACO3NK_15770 [Prochlorotrichaceae cyanobacterium]|jgi:hypothetical protein